MHLLAGGSKRGRRFFLASVGGAVFLTLMALALVIGVPGAQATTLTAPYVGVTVKAGQTVTLDVNISDTVTQKVDLSLQGVPEGWEANLLGAGRPISAIMTDPEEKTSIDLQVKVPAEAKEGTVTITVVARTSTGTLTLPFTFTVSKEKGGTTSLESDYVKLRGPADAEYTFNLTLKNDSETEQSYNLSVSAPEGWTVSLKPSGATQETPTVTVNAGSSQRLNFKVNPPDDTPAGVYDLAVTATGGGEEVTTAMQVEITGSYKLAITTPDGRLNADVKAGTVTKVNLVVTNSGTGPLQGVKLSASAPADWEVTFEPAVIDVLPANQQQNVVAKFKPAQNAIAGDYVVTISARGDQASASSDIRVTVKTSTLWGVIGVLIAIAAIVILALIFRRFGHR